MTMPYWCVNFTDALKMMSVVLTLFFLRRVVTEGFKDLTTYRMDYYCGQSLDLFRLYQFLVEFEPDNVVLPAYACDLTFIIHDPELRASVRIVEFEEGSNCSRRLELKDLSYNNHYSVCNTYQAAGVFTTESNKLGLSYRYGGRKPAGSFKLVVTMFHTGSCSSDEVKCSNGHCIKHEIYCNGHKPCGDDSEKCGDETVPSNNSVTTIILAVVATFLVLVIVGATIYACCCRNTRCTNNDGSNQQTSRFWFDVFTTRGTTESTGVTNEGAELDEPPDYNSLTPPPNINTLEEPPAYDEVLNDTLKYKVSDQTIEYI